MVSFRSIYQVKTTVGVLFYSLSPILCNHVTYLTHLDILYESSQFADYSFCHPCCTFPCIYLHRFQVHILLMRHLPRDHNIPFPSHDLEQTINKPFIRLIGLIYVTTSREVTHQIQVAKYSPRVLGFSRVI